MAAVMKNLKLHCRASRTGKTPHPIWNKPVRFNGSVFFGWDSVGTFDGNATYRDDDGKHDIDLLDIRIVAGHLLIAIKDEAGITYRYVFPYFGSNGGRSGAIVVKKTYGKFTNASQHELEEDTDVNVTGSGQQGCWCVCECDFTKTVPNTPARKRSGSSNTPPPAPKKSKSSSEYKQHKREQEWEADRKAQLMQIIRTEVLAALNNYV